MVLRVATTSLHWSHPSVPQTPSSAQALAPSVSSKRRNSIDGAMFCHRSSLFGYHQSSIYRSLSYENLGSRSLVLRRALSTSLASFSDEEFSKKIQELALRFRHSDDNDKEQTSTSDSRIMEPRHENGDEHDENFKPFDAVMEHPSFLERDEIIPTSIERRANSVDIPFSLGIIRRKKQLQGGFKEAGGLAYSSVKKAFSSMVFIIQELSSYSLQMRENLFYEDLQGILARVQEEMNASFVWLFQQVFSHTPMLMVYVMILLANYSVYSMSINPTIAAISPAQQTYTEEVSVSEDQSSIKGKFDSSIIRMLNLSSSVGKTTSIGGNDGGGGKHIPVASGEDGDGRFDESNYNCTVVPKMISSLESSITNGKLVSNHDKEVVLSNSFVEEASRIQDLSRDEALDLETMQGFTSPVDGKIETDDQAEYFKTELQYQTALAHEPNNSLLLANYAQFLYLVTHAFDRAEAYFKRAIAVEPKDAEACNKYAEFMWKVRNDLWAAEEIYQEAIDAEPENSYYAANYANFLWNTGGEETCFVSPDSSFDV